MNTARLCALVMMTATACDGAAPPASPGSRLTGAELARARAVPSSGDAVMSFNGSDYVGSAILEIQTGPMGASDGRLNILGLSESRAELSGQILIPEQTALALGSDGWDFTSDDAAVIGAPEGISGTDLHLPMTLVQIRADPDGLFVATYTFAGADGVPVIVTAAGRITGGCAHIDEEGTVTRVADISTVPRCEQALGSL